MPQEISPEILKHPAAASKPCPDHETLNVLFLPNGMTGGQMAGK
jgi:hypothetical protein